MAIDFGEEFEQRGGRSGTEGGQATVPGAWEDAQPAARAMTAGAHF